MTDPTIPILLERLLWPVPRVRWEAARALARLIRQNNAEAPRALLDWISSRELESEAVLGLDIIEAFDLSSYFTFAQISRAVQAPSHLSNLILKQNFPGAINLPLFRFAVSSEEPANLSLEIDSWFERYRKWAVPPIFSDQFERLERATGFPFMSRWKHEWSWLQAIHQRPSAEYPLYFSRGDRERLGYFDHAQRELYVSAYLRTLAYATMRGPLIPADAEQFSLLALPFTRGLADLQPIERPHWTYDLTSTNPENIEHVAECLWNSSTSLCNSDETPISLRIFEANKEGFIDFDIVMTLTPLARRSADSVEIMQYSRLVNDQSLGRYETRATQHPIVRVPSLDRPVALAELFQPKYIGRAHIGLGDVIRLASPRIFGIPAEIVCDEAEIRLDTADGTLSRWIHWYADWEPVNFPELEPIVCSLVTVSQSNIDSIQQLLGTQLDRWVRVQRADRSSSYGKYEVTSEVFRT